jgi:FKBP-type peptidyl-prolyl cis-trans isomerase FkpA
MALKNGFLTSVVVLSVLLVASCSKQGGGHHIKGSVKTEKEKVSYALGIDIGKSLKNVPSEIDLPSIQQGMNDGYLDQPALMTPEEARTVKDEANKKAQAERAVKRKADSEKNIAEAAVFFDKNKLTTNVETTASGLQYTILTKGTGPKPKADDIVKFSFVGTLLDGKEFDSSEKRKGPIFYKVSNAMKGVAEALQLMPVGSKWRVFIPPSLGYGPGGQPPLVGPDAALIYDIELLEIAKQDKTPPVKPMKKK